MGTFQKMRLGYFRPQRCPLIYHQKSGANGDGSRIFFLKNLPSLTGTFLDGFRTGPAGIFQNPFYARQLAQPEPLAIQWPGKTSSHIPRTKRNRMEGYCKFFHALRDGEKTSPHIPGTKQSQMETAAAYFLKNIPSLTGTIILYFQKEGGTVKSAAPALGHFVPKLYSISKYCIDSHPAIPTTISPCESAAFLLK